MLLFARLLPVAQRLHLGFTLKFKSLFLCPLKSIVIEDATVMQDRTIENRNPTLQILIKVPVILQNVLSSSVATC